MGKADDVGEFHASLTPELEEQGFGNDVNLQKKYLSFDPEQVISM